VYFVSDIVQLVYESAAVCAVEKVVDVFVCDVDNHVVAED